MNQNKVIFLLMSASAPLLFEARRSDHRAIKRDLEVKSKYPYIVALLMEKLLRAGTGSLITPEWVLTAAHCFDQDIFYIQYGNMSQSSISLIIEKTRHPSYQPTKMSNDIGLCRVKSVELHTYGVLSAIDYASLLGKPVEYAGYNLSQPQALLEVGKGIVIPWQTLLGESHGPMVGVAPKCSATYGDTATGHSGGPMFYDGKLAGIISFGEASPGPIGPYTAISSYTTWIQDVISQNNKKKMRIRRRKFVIKLLA